MGLDAQIYVKGNITEEHAKHVSALLLNRVPGFVDDWEKDGAVFTRSKYDDDGRYVVQTLSRYYDEAYERGNWPDIYAVIMLLKHQFPWCTVHYGSDSTDDCPEVTADYLADTWAHWASDDGDAYHDR